jgi:group I intron endonuclease
MEGVFGIIYKITCITNNKIYIGQTIDFEKRIYSHIRNANKGLENFLYRAIRKYGIDNFNAKIIDYAFNEEGLYQKELYWINFYDSTNSSKGYNISLGGKNPRLKGDKNPNFGGLKPGVAEKISKALIGKPSLNKGKKRSFITREKIRKANLGKKYSKEINKKKGRDKKGDKNPMFGKRGKLSPLYGKPRSKETILKIKQSRLKNGSGKGEKNPRAKTWKIIFCDGSEIIIKSLKTWCIKQNINKYILMKKLKNKEVYFNIKYICEIKKDNVCQ